MKFTLPESREQRDVVIANTFVFRNGECNVPDSLAKSAARTLIRYYGCTADGDLGDIEVVGTMLDAKGQPVQAAPAAQPQPAAPPPAQAAPPQPAPPPQPAATPGAVARPRAAKKADDGDDGDGQPPASNSVAA